MKYGKVFRENQNLVLLILVLLRDLEPLWQNNWATKSQSHEGSLKNI
jgi:hypothetical protein